jgi:hypothetical protein
VDIIGDCKVIYRPHKPLSCGARLWIETKGEVIPVTEPQGKTLMEVYDDE